MDESSAANDRKVEYRDLLDKIENLNDNDSINATPEFISQTLQRANILFKAASTKEKVKHTDEVLLDAKVVATASEVLLKLTNQLDCASDTYDALDFARRIRSKFMQNDVDEDSDAYYETLIEATQHLYNGPLEFCSFFGPIGKLTEQEQTPPKQRKVREKQQTREDEARMKKAPERITQADKEEDSVDDTVKFLHWSLTKEYEQNNNKPISYYQFLIDPNSFTVSVENLFHASFLVRDGRVKLESDLSGNLFLSPVNHNEMKLANKNRVDYKQFMFDFDVKKWNVIKSDKQIKKYFLEGRKKEWEKIKNKL